MLIFNKKNFLIFFYISLPWKLHIRYCQNKESNISEEQLRGISEKVLQERGSDKMALGHGVIDFDEFCEAMENINFETETETENDFQELSD